MMRCSELAAHIPPVPLEEQHVRIVHQELVELGVEVLEQREVSEPGLLPQRAARARRPANSRNPGHFDGIEGGRGRVSDTLFKFIDKNSVWCTSRSTAIAICTFWRQNTVWDTCGPRLK